MTTRPPLFSIVTIAKNNLHGLQATQASIDAQSCRNFEWIVVDGNSADGTRQHLETVNAVWTSEPDRGIYDAMNKGLERARGDYLLFLNAGDRLADADILSTLSKATGGEPDFIYGDALESNGLYKKARSHKKIAWGMVTHHQAMLYRRKTVGALRYDDTLKIAADYGFTAAFLKHAPDAHYVPCAICIFEDGGVSQRNRKLGRREQFGIRQAADVCPPWKNWTIYGLQTLSALCRERAPAVYYRLRQARP